MGVLGYGQEPVIMTHYPHMLWEDTAIWTVYLADPITEIKKVWYDVHVGKPVDLPPGASEMELRIAAGITRKRIDVVAAVGGGYWVIELKGVGNMTALGQAKVYSRLFRQEYRPAGDVWGIVICGEVDEDLLDDYDELDIGLIVV